MYRERCYFYFSKVLIQGLENMNRAVQDDIVAIELFPKSKWSCPSSLALVDEGEKGDNSVQKEVISILCMCRLTFLPLQSSRLIR